MNRISTPNRPVSVKTSCLNSLTKVDIPDCSSIDFRLRDFQVFKDQFLKP